MSPPLVVALVALLVIWIAWLQFQLFVSRRVIRAFQRATFIVPHAEKKPRSSIWLLLFLLPLVSWLAYLTTRGS